MICVKTISLQYQQYDMCSYLLFTKPTLWYVLKPALYKTNIMRCVETDSLKYQHYDMC